MRILVADDEPEFSGLVVEALLKENYVVDLAENGADALELMRIGGFYDLVVIDWSMPPPTGIEVVRTWRRQGLDVPVLMLTVFKEASDKVAGLDAGADDYLTKPFSVAELLARVRSLLRRRGRPSARLCAGDLELDPSAHRASVAGREIELTPRELEVLKYLLERLGKVVSRAELAERVWGEQDGEMSNVIDVILSRLRRKVDGSRAERLCRLVNGRQGRLEETAEQDVVDAGPEVVSDAVGELANMAAGGFKTSSATWAT
ncbi:MAG: response regulator, partial [Thermoanaerobaculia bacterium]|nr:response regulator [Thermoanaerobaculia bacterium]